MEHKDSKNDLFLLTIVGIVAIVAIVILVASTGSRTYLSDNTVGAASRATTSTDFSTEGKTVADTTATKTAVSTICTDSDGGKKYNVKGTTKAGKTTKTDFCRNYDSPVLAEYYCNRNKIASVDYTCPYGCENGACKNQTVAYCGDGVINGGEQCDGSNLGQMTCTDFGNFTGGTLRCNSDCTFDTSNCTGIAYGVCGDGIINIGEQCEYGVPLTAQCTDFGNFIGGNLACDYSTCQYDISGCVAGNITGYCGDNLINNFPNEQCDGMNWGQINSCLDFGFTGGVLSCNTPNETNRCKFNTSLCQTPAGHGVCGDRIIQAGEQCEEGRPFTLGCTDFDSFTGGTLECDYSTCQYDISGCVAGNITGYCGDGIINPGEQCDGNDLGTLTCTDIGLFTGGTLSCYPAGSPLQCTIDTRNCTTGTVSRRFSTNSVQANTTLTVTLTKNFAYQQGSLLIEEYVPSSFVILSNGGGTVSGNTIRWALLNNISPGNYTYTVRASAYPGTYTFSGLYGINGASPQNILGSTQVIVQNPIVQTGNLEVQTTPTGASLYVDNIYKGTTPKTVTNLTVGNHAIKLTKTGYYTYTTTKYIYAGQTAFLNVTLTQNMTQSCSDSDGGINYNVFGTLTFTNGSYSYNYTDYCSTSSTLYERYCAGSLPSISIYTCPYGCSGGRCLQNQTGTWTQWFDRDNGSGSGDWENKIYFPTVCSNPLSIECYTVSGIPASQTGQVTHCDLNKGFWCLNSENNQTCLDYKVRWLCP